LFNIYNRRNLIGSEKDFITVVIGKSTSKRLLFYVFHISFFFQAVQKDNDEFEDETLYMMGHTLIQIQKANSTTVIRWI